jgi:acyl-[acyl-carrier-protein] desaturase
MASRTNPDSPFLSATIYSLYRDFFDQAERRRRWRVKEDIPWHQCNPNVNPAVGDVVESFCAVELYLPDYLGKILPHIRASRNFARPLSATTTPRFFRSR